MAKKIYRTPAHLRSRVAQYQATPRGKALAMRHRQKYRRSVDRQYARYADGATRRGIIFSLSLEQFKSFWQKACVYCADAIDTIGLDRVDNALGYCAENVVSCCAVCNLMKRSLPEEVFVEHCRKVARAADLAGLL